MTARAHGPATAHAASTQADSLRRPGGRTDCDRSLAGGGTTPDVALAVQLSPSAPAGSVLNTAQVTATEGLTATAAAAAKAGGNPPRTTLARQSSALILSAGSLAMTGATPQFALQLGLALLALGVLMAVGKPRRRRA